MLAEFARRRQRMVNGINALPGLSCGTPEGAFYVFADVASLFGRTLRGQKITGSVSLAELFLVEAHVAVVPGAAFGDDRYVRFSYATSLATIDEGLARLHAVLSEVR
jgi:aspartate aminotransferase